MLSSLFHLQSMLIQEMFKISYADFGREFFMRKRYYGCEKFFINPGFCDTLMHRNNRIDSEGG
jgi:hypothetical protein